VKRRALLDVNVLIALFDPEHVHHQAAHDWFADHGSNGWATCAVSEIGFVRVVSHPEYASGLARPAEAIALLRQFCSSRNHEFWPDAISLRDEDVVNQAFIAGPRQLTDIYLLGVAVRHRGCLATFDRAIPIGAVVGATADSLAVIAPVD
jgi:toxin-antitoxin system PIN domain toxin